MAKERCGKKTFVFSFPLPGGKKKHKDGTTIRGSERDRGLKQNIPGAEKRPALPVVPFSPFHVGVSIKLNMRNKGKLSF